MYYRNTVKGYHKWEKVTHTHTYSNSQTSTTTTPNNKWQSKIDEIRTFTRISEILSKVIYQGDRLPKESSLE